MDYNKAALELHSKFPGKIAVQSLCELQGPRRAVHRLYPRRGRAVPQDQGKPR